MRRAIRRPGLPSGRQDAILGGLLLALLVAAVILFGGARPWAFGPVAAGILALAAWVFARAACRPGRHPWIPVPGLAAWLAVCGYIGVRMVWRAGPPLEAREELLRVGVALAAYASFAQLRGAGARWRGWVGVFFGLVWLLCLYALVLHYRGERWVLWQERPEVYGLRASATYGCPNHFAHFLAISGAVALALLFTPRARGGVRLLAGYALALIPLAMALTLSRGGLIGGLAGLAAVCVVLAWRRGGRRLRIASLLLPFVLVGGVALLRAASPAWRARLAPQGVHEQIRPRLWRDTVTLWKASPVWGAGPGSFDYALSPHRHHYYETDQQPRYAHNEYLHVLAEYGAAGAALVGLAGALALAGLLRRHAGDSAGDGDAGWQAALAGAWASSLAQAVVDFNFHIPGNVLWLAGLSGLGLARLAANGQGPGAPAGTARRWMLGLGAAACLGLAADAVRQGAGDAFRLRWEEQEESVRPDLALETARRAVRWDAGHLAARVRIGEILAAQAQWLRRQPERMRPLLDDAERHLLRAVAGNPLAPDARCALARVRLLQGRTAEAVEEIRTVERLAPALVYYALQQARLYVEAGMHREALAAFERARKLDFHNEAAWAGVHSMKRLLGLPISNPGPPPRPEARPPVEPGRIL